MRMIRIEREGGSYTVYYGSEEIGWIDRLPRQSEAPYRACNKRGRLGYFWSLNTAKDFLISEEW